MKTLITTIVLSLFIYGISSSYLSSSSSSSSSICKQIINSVSEVNPYTKGLVEIIGELCTKESTDYNIEFLANISNTTNSSNIMAIECSNLVFNENGKSITCSLNEVYTSPIIFNQFHQVNIKNVVTNSTSIISNYLFTNSTCPNKCNKHGKCDISEQCRCDIGFASFDCTQKVTNDTLPIPTGVAFDTFKITTSLDVFNIKMSNILYSNSTTPKIKDNLIYQSPISNMSITEETSTSLGLSFSASLYNNWLTGLIYSVIYYNNNNNNDSTKKTSFSFTNFNGAYLPITSTSASISIYPIVNILNLPNNSNSSFLTVLEITNVGNTMKSVPWQLSEALRSVSFINKKTNSLLLFSLSDIFTFNNTIVPNHAHLHLISNEDALNLLDNYNDGSVYLSVVIPNSLQQSGVYNIELMVNSYNLKPFKLTWWEIMLIVFASVTGFGFLVLVLVLIIKYRLNKLKSKKLQLKSVKNHNNSNINEEHSDDTDNENNPLLN